MLAHTHFRFTGVKMTSFLQRVLVLAHFILKLSGTKYTFCPRVLVLPMSCLQVLQAKNHCLLKGTRVAHAASFLFIQKSLFF